MPRSAVQDQTAKKVDKIAGVLDFKVITNLGTSPRTKAVIHWSNKSGELVAKLAVKLDGNIHLISKNTILFRQCQKYRMTTTVHNGYVGYSIGYGELQPLVIKSMHCAGQTKIKQREADLDHALEESGKALVEGQRMAQLDSDLHDAIEQWRRADSEIYESDQTRAMVLRKTIENIRQCEDANIASALSIQRDSPSGSGMSRSVLSITRFPFTLEEKQRYPLGGPCQLCNLLDPAIVSRMRGACTGKAEARHHMVELAIGGALAYDQQEQDDNAQAIVLTCHICHQAITAYNKSQWAGGR
jgi:hypothetical protein